MPGYFQNGAYVPDFQNMQGWQGAGMGSILQQAQQRAHAGGIGGIQYQPRQQNSFPMGMSYGRRPMRLPNGMLLPNTPQMFPTGGDTRTGATAGMFGAAAPPAQGGYQYPFQFPEMMGLGDFYTPHGPGDAQNVSNATTGANFIGNQWGQNAIMPGQPQQSGGYPAPNTGYMARRY